MTPANHSQQEKKSNGDKKPIYTQNLISQTR